MPQTLPARACHSRAGALSFEFKEAYFFREGG